MVAAVPFVVLAVAALGVAAAGFVAPFAEAVAAVAAVLVTGVFGAGFTAVLEAGLTGLTLGVTGTSAGTGAVCALSS